MADEDFLVQHPDKDENDVELSWIGAIKYVFYLSTNGKLAKWSSDKHPRDKNGRWIKTSSSSYIYGKSERASFSAVPGSSDVQVTLQPGDRVWRMSTGSRIVQHADGTGEFYVNSNPNDKTNLSAAGVDGMLQVKALDAQLEQAVPGHVVKANNEKDAERAFGSPSTGGSNKSTPSAPRAPKNVPSGGSSGSREVSPTEGAPSAKKPRRTHDEEGRKLPFVPRDVPGVPDGDTSKPLPYDAARRTRVGKTLEERQNYLEAWQARGREDYFAHPQKELPPGAPLDAEKKRKDTPFYGVQFVSYPDDGSKVNVNGGAVIYRGDGTADFYHINGGDSVKLTKTGADALVEDHKLNRGGANAKNSANRKLLSRDAVEKKYSQMPDPAPKNDEDKSDVQKATEEAGRRAAAKEALERYKKEQEKRKQQEKASKTTEEFKDQTFTEPKETVVSHSELGDIRVKLEPGAKLYQTDNGFIVLYTGNKPPVLFKENGKTANPGLSTHEISQLPLKARISLKGRVQEFDAKDKKKSPNDSKQVNKDPFKTETPKPRGEHSATTDSSSNVDYVSQEKYDEMMKMFESLGITEVDGIPVTERYKVRKKK